MSVFTGRNVMADTSEMERHGSVVLNKRPTRVRITELMGEINDFDRMLFQMVENLEHRNILRDKLKVSKRMINSL